MCDVLFITPNDTGLMEKESIGTLQLATILKEKGIDCLVVPFGRIGDMGEFAKFLDNTLQLVVKKQPKIVSFYTRCDTYHVSLRMAQHIKNHYPNIYVVCGGPQSDITAEESLRQIKWVDFICCGEGETTVYPFFSSLLKGKPDLSVAGLVYRNGDEICKNPRPEFIADLDTLPMIDYSLVDDVNLSENHFPIDVGRGCPFACTFCSTKTFWGRKYRLKSPQRIVAEIRDIHDRFGKTRFSLSHDMFTMNRNKVLEVCRLIKELDYPIEWGCSARTDCIDREMIDIMADAGMKGIYFGIETGSPRMQQIINKKLKLDTAVDLIQHLVNKGVEPVVSFIYGFPEENEEDICCTMSMIAKLLALQHVTVQTHLCAFMVGTELTTIYKNQLTPAEVFSNITAAFAVEECKDLIQANPNLFQHMLEYKTELRSKLRYFTTFFLVWKKLQPVFQYISEKYPEERLLDMYYDFVDANKDVLDSSQSLFEYNYSVELLKCEKFLSRYSQDPNFDILSDICRLRATELSDAVKNGEEVTEIFCVDPGKIQGKRIQDMERCMAVVTWHNKKRTCKVYSLN